MATKHDTVSEPKAAEIFELKEELKIFKEQFLDYKKTTDERLKRTESFCVKADPVLVATEKMVSVYGEYTGTDKRCVPAVITGAFPRAGTVDVIVFDNRDSGGGRDMTGITLGKDKNEMCPYLEPTPAEDTADELVANQS